MGIELPEALSVSVAGSTFPSNDALPMGSRKIGQYETLKGSKMMKDLYLP